MNRNVSVGLDTSGHGAGGAGGLTVVVVAVVVSVAFVSLILLLLLASAGTGAREGVAGAAGTGWEQLQMALVSGYLTRNEQAPEAFARHCSWSSLLLPNAFLRASSPC